MADLTTLLNRFLQDLYTGTIGGTTPWTSLTLTKSALGVTPGTALTLQNQTAAAAGAQQISPAVQWRGRGWKTDATAGSQTVDFFADVLPVQGTSAPSGALRFGYAINGGARTDVLSLSPTAVTSGVPILAPDGLVSAPAYSFTDAPTTGHYLNADNTSLMLALGGIDIWRWDNNPAMVFHSAAALQWGSSGVGSPDVSLSRGAANRLDLATGDSFYIVGGGLGVGVSPPGSGQVTATQYNLGSLGNLVGSDDAKWIIRNNGGTAGVGLDFATDGLLKVRVRAQNAFADIQALRFYSSAGNVLYGGIGDGIWQMTNVAANGFTRLILGTNDASGVSLKKNATQIQVRLGDDTGYADFVPAAVLAQGNISSTGFILPSVTAAITASTTQTQGQQPLVTEINNVSTCANANDVVTLPAAVAGAQCVIFNNGAQTLQIFPASGDNLGAGVDASATLNAGSNRRYVAFDSTNWEIV